MIPVEVHVPDAGPRSDVVVKLTGDVTIGEVFDALSLPPNTQVDGAAIEAPALTPAHQVLRAGSELLVTQVPTSTKPVEGFVDVAVVAGFDAGAIARLGPGLFHVSVNHGDLQDSAEYDGHSGWVLQIEDRQPLLAQPRPWHVHGHSIETIAAGTGPMLALAGPIDPEPAQRVVDSGTVIVNRPPRPATVPAIRPVSFEDSPAVIRDPAQLSWATLLAPIPIALMMAFFFRPIFALFAAMGPIMAVGRWWESRRRFRRATAERQQQIAQMRADLADQLVEQAETEAQRRWRSHPHVGALWRRASTGSVRLWQRRAGDPGFMQATIGVGPAACPAVIVDKAIPPDLCDMLEGPLVLRPVPHVVDLSIEPAVGLVGPRLQANAVARSLVAQLATAHGPADLHIGVLCTPENAGSWDWLKWLPHVDGQLVSHDASAIAATMAPAPPGRARTGRDVGSRPVHLIIVDDPDADVAAVVRAAAEADIELRCLAVASEPTLLPAVCSAICTMAGDELVIETASSPGLSGVTPTGISTVTAESWARSLAKFRDPEVTPGSSGRSRRTPTLLELVGHRSTSEQTQHWAQRRADANPVVVLGQGPAGPFELDLTSDGPHALIAGTTGSGKSELLRTLVAALAAECPPERLNLVLIDFKGGGAFDVVRDLPHVVGLITDLDESLVSRALLSLRAELERRERLLRELGVSTFEQAAAIPASSPLARLVIIIDEFAALATDYGDLMSGIIDLAARGRSLGMHLVLATQRPSGVVDQKIRANTNIRIALRVQDEFDSQDVVGTAEAATIDRRAQGRAIVRVGGDRPIGVQMAYSGGRDTRRERLSVHPHQLFDNSKPTHDTDAGDTDAGEQTELQILMRTIVEAANHQESAPRALWAPPLPAHLDWIDLGSRELAGTPSTSGYALGLADMPERQTQIPWRWDPTLGALGIFGASGTDAGKAMVSLGAAMALASGPEALHLYIIDGHAGASSVLESLPHTGACVRADETDRVDRLVRLFESTLGQRRTAPPSDQPAMVLMIDNLAARR